jgi:hypothetical protein
VGSIETFSCCHASWGHNIRCFSGACNDPYILCADKWHPLHSSLILHNVSSAAADAAAATSLQAGHVTSKCSRQPPTQVGPSADTAEYPVAPLMQLSSTGNAWSLTAKYGPEHTPRLERLHFVLRALPQAGLADQVVPPLLHVRNIRHQEAPMRVVFKERQSHTAK